MDKVDYKKQLKDLYHAKVGVPVTVDVPKMNFIMVDGHGDPNTSEEYVDAIQALYPVAYGIKFICKKEHGNDFGVMPLEGLWWTENMQDFSTVDKSNWQWTAMIMQPDVVSKDIFSKAVEQASVGKNPRALSKVRFEAYEEGRAAQIMHVGPYSAEGPTIQVLHLFIRDSGGRLDKTNKHHHEIYLGDPRRSDPSKLKTIIRQPY